MINQQNVPTEAFLYKYPSAVVKQAASNVFAKFGTAALPSADLREYYTFSGDSLGIVLMSGTRIKYWIEELGDEKSVIYLTAFDNKTNQYVAALRRPFIQGRMKTCFNYIEVECTRISGQLFLSEQYAKVFQLTNELQALFSDLQEMEANPSSSRTQINQLRSSIRIKKANLDKETDILNRLKLTLEL